MNTRQHVNANACAPTTERNYVVYVDTSYLSFMQKEQIYEWDRLLQYAKDCREQLSIRPRVEIYIHHVALEEYRTQSKDNLIAATEKARTAINKLERAWGGNPIGKRLSNSLSEDFLISNDKIEKESHELISELKNQGVFSVDIDLNQANEVFARYFNWEPPFDRVSPASRDGRSERESRRKDIPDAWIYVAAKDLIDNGRDVLFLCGDENLRGALRALTEHVFDDASKIFSIIEESKNIIKESNNIVEATPESASINSITSANSISSPLDDLLSKAFDGQHPIWLRLLGFVEALDTPTHSELIDKVATISGVRPETVALNAKYLASGQYLRDTGNHYIVGNQAICKEAADRLTGEIIKMLDLSE